MFRKGSKSKILLACLLALGTGCSVLRSGDKEGKEAPETPETRSVEVSGTVDTQPSTLEELRAATASVSPPPWLGAQAGDTELSGNLAIANLEESRLLAVRPGFLVESASKEPVDHQFEILRVSPVVGAAAIVHQVGSDLIIAATNQSELVRMKPDWKHLDTLPLATIVGVKGVSDYGAILEYKDSLFVTMYFDGKTALFEVDPIRWVVKKHRIYTDRFTLPSACITQDGQIAFVSRSIPGPPGDPALDFIDPTSLDRQKSVVIASVGDVECIGETVWISNYDTPRGEVFGINGKRIGKFEWTGKGSQQLLYSALHGRLFGSDQSGGVVFSCDVKSRACRTGPTIKAKGKPTDFTLIGNKMFLDLELAQSIAVLDAVSLRSFGTVGFPGSYGFAGSPRVMTLLK